VEILIKTIPDMVNIRLKVCCYFAMMWIAAMGSTSCSAWGVWAHYRINAGAVYCLPDSLSAFFYRHMDYVTEESVAPDIRKHDLKDKAESIRHFLDLESLNLSSFTSLPPNWDSAADRYTADTLKRYGILPWAIIDFENMLTRAFRERNKPEILFLAANLGHYVGDAHMPLHTSANHDGQLTDQKGIHGLWEAELPELFGSDYKMYPGQAAPIANVNASVLAGLDNCHGLAARLLETEKQLRGQESNVFVKTDSGKAMKNKYGQPVFSRSYAKKYHDALNGMVEQQIKSAVQMVAGLWLTAWRNAGSPDLSTLDKPNAEAEKECRTKVAQFRKTGKLPDIVTDNEYSVP
jgi:hypothetical protein